MPIKKKVFVPALLLAFFVGMGCMYLLCSNMLPLMPQSNAAAISDYVYDELQRSGDALLAYHQSGSGEDLADAKDAIAKVITVCRACEDSYEYRSDYDSANDIICEWGVNFLICVYHYIDEKGLESDPATMETLADVFCPLSEQGDHTTFFSLFWNACQTDLDQTHPEWMVNIVYENGVLQRPDFAIA